MIANHSNQDINGTVHVAASAVRLESTQIENNIALRGAGLLSKQSNVTLVTSRVFNNTAGLAGGGLFIDGESQPVTLSASTITSNTAPYGAGIACELPACVSNASISGVVQENMGGDNIGCGDMNFIASSCDTFGCSQCTWNNKTCFLPGLFAEVPIDENGCACTTCRDPLLVDGTISAPQY